MVNKYLAFLACGLASAAVFAQPRDSKSADLRSVIGRSAATHPVPPHRLSDAERAELRRQLSQYSRMPVKGS